MQPMAQKATLCRPFPDHHDVQLDCYVANMYSHAFECDSGFSKGCHRSWTVSTSDVKIARSYDTHGHGCSSFKRPVRYAASVQIMEVTLRCHPQCSNFSHVAPLGRKGAAAVLSASPSACLHRTFSRQYQDTVNCRRGTGLSHDFIERASMHATLCIAPACSLEYHQASTNTAHL